jgi:adenine phosphoribosyltransferase
MTKIQLEKSIRNVPDFPKPGILFKDITTALRQAELLKYMVDELYQVYKDKGITRVAGIESRGFILGSALAYRLNAGFVPIRKPGKLPAETYRQSYELEYGTDSLEVHTDAFDKSDVVLIHDDLLATGGTAKAALDLVKRFQVSKISLCFMCELTFLNGREKMGKEADIFSLLSF